MTGLGVPWVWQARDAGIKSDDDEKNDYRQAPKAWILSTVFRGNSTNYRQYLSIGLHQWCCGLVSVGT